MIMEPTYSEIDLKNDINRLLQYSDVSNHSLNQFDIECNEQIQHCFSSLRVLKFAQESLAVEANNLHCHLLVETKEFNSRIQTTSTQPLPIFKSIPELTAQLPFVAKVSNIRTCETYFIPESSEPCQTTLKQIRKDVSRDKFLINGQLFIGGISKAGIDELKILMVDTIDRLIFESGLPLWNGESKDNYIMDVVKCCSRTHCGGIAFCAVQEIIGSALSDYIIVPESSSSIPIRIRFMLGDLENRLSGDTGEVLGAHLESGLRWGLRADIEANSNYSLKYVGTTFAESETNAGLSENNGSISISSTFSAVIGHDIDISISHYCKSKSVFLDRGNISLDAI